MRHDRWHVRALAAMALWAFPGVLFAQAEDPMKPLLRAWEKQSARLDTLDVEIARKDNSPAWGDSVSQEHVLEVIQRRDARDSERATAPMRAADDADVLDTTQLSIEAALAAAMVLIESQLARARA